MNGPEVRLHRQTNGLTQAELAERCGVSRSLIALIESNRASIPPAVVKGVSKLPIQALNVLGASPVKRLSVVLQNASTSEVTVVKQNGETQVFVVPLGTRLELGGGLVIDTSALASFAHAGSVK